MSQTINFIINIISDIGRVLNCQGLVPASVFSSRVRHVPDAITLVSVSDQGKIFHSWCFDIHAVSVFTG